MGRDSSIDWQKMLDEIDKGIQEFRRLKGRAPKSVQVIAKSDLDQLDQGIATVRKLQLGKEANPFDDQRRDAFVDVERLADELMVEDRSLTREQAVAQALNLRTEIYDKAVLMKQQNPELDNLDLEDFAAISKILEEQVTEAQTIAKRFERNPQAYQGLLYQDPSRNDWYQAELERLAKIDRQTVPTADRGKVMAADAAKRLAKQLQDQDPSLSDLDAITKAYEQSPDLYMR